MPSSGISCAGTGCPEMMRAPALRSFSTGFPGRQDHSSRTFVSGAVIRTPRAKALIAAGTPRMG